MKSKPVKIGIVGCGSVLGAYMAAVERLRAECLIEVVATCGRPNQRRVAEEFGLANFTTNAAEVIRSRDVDLLVVLTSMPSHGPIARAALKAGKHVLVEKPMSVDLREAAELVRLAQKTKRHLVCAPFTILSPTFQKIWQHVHRGDIGKVLSARARYGWAGPTWSKWFYRPGGGALFDLGVYNVTTLTGLLGPAKRVMAMTGIAIPQRVVNGEPLRVQAEDNAHVLIDFGDAVFASVITGFTLQQYRGPALELYGAAGTVQMMGDDWDPDGYELWQNSLGAWQIFKETDPDWPWTDGLRHTVGCLYHGTAPLVTAQHAFHVLEIMIKAKACGRDGKARRIDSTFAPLVFEPATASEPMHLIHDRTRRK